MKINEIINEIISDTIQNLDWKCPFVQASNPVTKINYKGINRLIANYHIQKYNLKSPYFLSYKQASSLGGKINKGASSCPIIHFSFIMKDEDGKITDDDSKAVSSFWKKSYFKVFNLDTISGIEFPLEKKEIILDKKLDSFIERYTRNLKEVRSVIGEAYYAPKEDIIGIPSPNMFTGIGEYYSTYFHELVHSTGHPSRLKRFKEDESASFGSESYSKEELIAELGAMLALEDTPYADKVRENSLVYLAGWYKKIQQPMTIVSAFSKAEEAKKLLFK